jgi:NitT/TauT family transport system ATP-binding protein
MGVGNLAARSGVRRAGEEIETLHADMLELDDVSVSYEAKKPRGRVLAVNGVSVSVKAAERFVILGPSGCGKSTLLHAIGGYLPIASGQLHVQGTPVRGPGQDRMFVFQDFDQLLPWKTVVENLCFALSRHRDESGARLSRPARREIARTYIDKVGLSKQGDQYPNTLSGGQKQRVAIARAFCLRPPVLLMDEPFGSLDALSRARMQDELNILWESQRTTVVFVTHDVEEAVRLGDRIMIMTPGPGTVRQVVQGQPGSPVRNDLVDEVRQLVLMSEGVANGGAR